MTTLFPRYTSTTIPPANYASNTISTTSATSKGEACGTSDGASSSTSSTSKGAVYGTSEDYSPTHKHYFQQN